MAVIVSLKDIVNEMDIMSDTMSAYLNRRTGELVTLSEDVFSYAEEDRDMEDSPEWEQEMVVKAKEILESDDYLPLPSKFDINEYHIMEDFCYSMNDDRIRIELLAGIKGRGAFRNFRDTMRRFGIQDQWYKFRDAEMKRIAIEWLEDNHIAYTRE